MKRARGWDFEGGYYVVCRVYVPRWFHRLWMWPRRGLGY